jgi:uncharacterized protein YneF (UPF0154 family)
MLLFINICIISMSVVYGVISYTMFVALAIGYFLVKKWGDKQAANNPLEGDNLSQDSPGLS